MTAIKLLTMLHHFMSTEPFPWPENTSYRDALAKLRAEGLLDDQSPPNPTDKGQAYVKMLRETPLPVQKWTDPR